MKKLPIGIQSFVNIRTEADYYYVDKTQQVAALVDKGKYFFLSRPRRFGKSLFLDTLRQAFLGRKELFNGLFLENNWNWEKKYPVIYISFGAGVHRSRDELQETMLVILKQHAKDYGVSLENSYIKDRFFELIQQIVKKYNQQVVVLIDEYDKPILDQIDKPEIAIEIREELKNFYSVIKDADQFLKFVFITGVSKFSKVSLFSGLNNLLDITIDPDNATICGYTHEEMCNIFAERLEGVDLEQVRLWYNGYNFLGDKVYNPFDILLFLVHYEFRNYWFETGSPSFLIKLIEKHKYPVIQLEKVETSETLLGSFDVEKIELTTLLWQTGYLTIKNIETILNVRSYELGYPNMEVKRSLTECILHFLTHAATDSTKYRIALYKTLVKLDLDGLRNIFHAFFASIPHQWYDSSTVSEYEAFYVSVFYCYFTALGFDVRPEEPTNHGRLDMAVLHENRVFIFEFKVVELDKTAATALEQIKRKKYWEKYLSPSSFLGEDRGEREIYIIGIEFSKTDRNIVNYEWERIG